MWPKASVMDLWSQSGLDLATVAETNNIVTTQFIDSFHVTAPIYTPADPSCTHLLLNHEFAFSYGSPFTTKYLPSKECGTAWSMVVMIFSATVSGRQFDRTGAIWLGGSELWRFTTQEPSGSSITRWNATKDVTSYAALFQSGQPLVIALDNVVNEVYTGIVNVTLSLVFYMNGTMSPDTADLIIPLSNSNSSYGWFTHPNDAARFVPLPELPSNINHAEMEIFFSHHAQDEFWYGNVPLQLADADKGLYPGGTFKELQVFIDSTLIGLEWPFPTIYTGGMNPLLWRPIVATYAFNLPTMRLDLVPFLSLLLDGRNHSVGFKVGTAANSLWYIDGNIKIWTDGPPVYNGAFNGSMMYYDISLPEPIEVVNGSLNTTATIYTTAKRFISASGRRWINGQWITSTNEKCVEFSNILKFTQEGNHSSWDQLTSITELSTLESSLGKISSRTEKAYPFKADILSSTIDNGSRFDAALTQGLHMSTSTTTGQENARDSLDVTLKASGYFATAGRKGSARTSVLYNKRDGKGCYGRNVTAQESVVLYDKVDLKC